MAFSLSRPSLPASAAPAARPAAAPAPQRGSIFSGIDTKGIRAKRPFLSEKTGTYWLRIETMKTGVGARTKKTYCSTDFSVVKVIKAPLDASGQSAGYGEGDLCVQTLMADSDFFQQDISLMAWGLLGDQFRQQGISSVQGLTPEALQESLEWMFGDAQPMTNQVVEIHNYEYITKPRDGSIGKRIVKTNWTGLVPVEILKDHLSDSAKTQFPLGYFDPAPAA